MFKLRRPNILLQHSLRWPLLMIALTLLSANTVMIAVAQTRSHTLSAPAEEISTTEELSSTPTDPNDTPSTLSGRLTLPENANRTVIAAVINNSPEARPQSGLSQADLIHEVVAEGGVTRYIAMFQSQSPEVIGPIRSLRPYFSDWALQYDAPLAHVGGSERALAEVNIRGLRSLNEFSNQFDFWRSTDRYAPHNVYTSTDKLRDLAERRGYSSSDFDPLPRKQPSPAESVTAESISISLSRSNSYNPSYIYDPAENNYIRSLGGEPHIDRENDQTISPSSIVVIVIPIGVSGTDGLTAATTTGSGQAMVFQDGRVVQGSWSRPSMTSQYRITDGSGQIIELNPGLTWMTYTSRKSNVNYSPAATTADPTVE